MEWFELRPFTWGGCWTYQIIPQSLLINCCNMKHSIYKIKQNNKIKTLGKCNGILNILNSPFTKLWYKRGLLATLLFGHSF